MADCVSAIALKNGTAIIPSTTTRIPSVFHQKRITPLRISALSAADRDSKRTKTTQWSQTALTSRFGTSSSFLRGPSEGLGESTASPIASSPSSDASASNEEDNNKNGRNDDSRSGWSPKDGYGLYPWDPSWQAMDIDDLQWIQEETITLFTSDGIVKLGGSRVVTRQTDFNERKCTQLRALSKLKRYREEDYMDPKQGLCLGAIFDIAATNGLDMGRRFCVFGFCRSIEMLSDVVQDTVMEQGGEVVIAEKGSTTGLREKLSMTVAMPALWGVPPAFDVLNNAIRSGGGIVEKTYKKWEFF